MVVVPQVQKKDPKPGRQKFLSVLDFGFDLDVEKRSNWSSTMLSDLLDGKPFMHNIKAGAVLQTELISDLHLFGSAVSTMSHAPIGEKFCLVTENHLR